MCSGSLEMKGRETGKEDGWLLDFAKFEGGNKESSFSFISSKDIDVFKAVFHIVVRDTACIRKAIKQTVTIVCYNDITQSWGWSFNVGILGLEWWK